jgi:two-component system nitrogen regulation response regulator GlnG
MPHEVLIVDDDAAVCWALERALQRGGYRVTVCGAAAQARRRIAERPPAVVLTDQRMPGGSGVELLADLRRTHPRLPVVLMTAYGSMETASAALTAGAYDYLPKPLDLDRTLAVVERAVGRRDLAFEAAPSGAVQPALVGGSPALQEAVRRLAMAAASDLPVLIGGPTGSGKGLAAALIHRHSRRAALPFLSVAGAHPLDGSAALVAAAAGGSLLIDEVADLPPDRQHGLVELVETAATAGVRVIATTNREPADALRPDLLHRLAVLRIDMPALAACAADIPIIAGHLLARASARLGRPLALTDAALEQLRARAWPGNARELQHALEEAAALAPGGTIDAEHLRPGAPAADAEAASAQRAAEDCLDHHAGGAHARWIDRHERTLFAAALARTRGNILRAAELLGLHRTTLRRRMDELGLGPAEGQLSEAPARG